MPSTFEWTISIVLPLILTCVALNNGFTPDHNNTEKTATGIQYFKLWFLYMFLDSAYATFFYLILLPGVRLIAFRLPGSVVPLHDEGLLQKQEEESIDISLVWPSPSAIAKLPQDWIVVESKDDTSMLSNDISGKDGASLTIITHASNNKKKRSAKNKQKQQIFKQQHHTENRSSTSAQSYYLNNVRGSTRIRQACLRIAAAAGTLVSSYILCSLTSSLVSLDDIGLHVPSLQRVIFDLVCGCLIGSFIVIFIFLIELQLEWIKIIGYCETVVPNEKFTINIIWDILFHIGVSINEEVMLRGWMFSLGCRGLLLSALPWFQDNPSNAAIFAIILSTTLQSTLFAIMHYSSPGCTYQSLLNLFFGGIAASLNVMVAGGTVWLGGGWHFGWNIWMGHLLGRSTSGIPMSCALIAIVPKPDTSYVKYHGGTNGPEQGMLAPIAYIMGMILVTWIYGSQELGAWKARLVTDAI